MELAKAFEPKGLDQRWYDRWLAHDLFTSRPDGREPYPVVIPPPNVTGVLHMGHALNNTIQDVLVRRARMQGKNTCWVPGTDHASIATEAKVVQMLREQGIKKSSLSREDFLKYAWEWKEKYGGIILQQLRKLGCSCDWSRTAFTMDDEYYRSVIRVFIDLYHKGYIYRDLRMIHWDPKAKTSLSDEEVIMKPAHSKLYYLKYMLVDGENEDGFITIATVRPETILGDTAICVNPKDERYRSLVGKQAVVPLIHRRIPIIADEYVEMEFGTGALKITPAHDANDYTIGLKHGLEVIDVLNEDGTMSAAAQLYVGQDRFECRKNIVTDLDAAGHLVKVEDYENQIGYSERTDAVVEPRLSMQWWCKMNTLAAPALTAVQNGEIRFHPEKFVNLYDHWMTHIRDWCVSRQLWWGHRIPAWYDEQGNFEVAESHDEALQLYKEHHPGTQISSLRQDEDVLDTWFSSWLWPFEVFHALSKPGNADAKYYYPTATLVTAPEIIFFWVARMIMAGYEFMGNKPFSHVYFTGIVRDKQGRKMSKSLGNSPDLLALIDSCGADAVRFGILIASPAGNDLLYDEKLVEQGRNFCNKMWNALRLVKGWEPAGGSPSDRNDDNSFALLWFEHRLNATLAQVEKLLDDFQISAALKTLYSLVWDDFCSWYLEMVKPEFGKPIDEATLSATRGFFERLMKVLHPFFPFITEEVYHLLSDRKEDDFITIAQYPVAQPADEGILQNGDRLKQLVSAIRDVRIKNQVKPRERLCLYSMNEIDAPLLPSLIKLGLLSGVEHSQSAVKDCVPFLCGADQFFLRVPERVSTDEETSRLEKELQYQLGFLEMVMKKLGNEKFTANARPEVVAAERKKASDAQEKIRLLEAQLKVN